VIGDQHFGEGRYEQSERVIQRLLGVEGELVSVSVDGAGVEAAADWDHLSTPETYLGYARSERFASPGGAAFDERRRCKLPQRMRFNKRALAGEWTIEDERVVLDQAPGRIAFRFQARDVNLVLRSDAREPVPFRVLLDGTAPGGSRGSRRRRRPGLLEDGRLYQLVRQGRDRRADGGDHVPRTGRRGVRVHVPVGEREQ
jgi:hypothetical protein